MIELKKYLLLYITIFIFNLSAFAEEEIITIVMFSTEQKIEIQKPLEIEIIQLKIFNLFNPYQFYDKIDILQNSNSIEVYSFSYKEYNLEKGKTYRVQVYVSTQSNPIEYTFTP